MRNRYTYKHPNKNIKNHILEWSKQFNSVICLDSNNYWENNSSKVSYHKYDSIIAVDSLDIVASKDNSFSKLKDFYNQNKDWLFGYISYDIKDESKNLISNNIDQFKLPNLYFFIPRYVFIINDTEVIIESPDDNLENLIDQILNQKIEKEDIPHVQFSERTSKLQYFDDIKKILKHIQYGDIYEMNYCMEFYNESVIIDPLLVYKKLCDVSPTPFSAYMNIDDLYLMCASPERFLKKINDKIISQPIKGTTKRGENEELDQLLIKELITSTKETSENVMIVDLVRNDLSKTAKKASVNVEELFGVYSFEQVHQLISTVSCLLDPGVHFIDAIHHAFPMGSMTGAPKIKAMQLIEKYEKTKRGIYSGSVGYIEPSGDFDFNVVIRSLIYSNTLKYLSYHVGGAITIKSDPEKEYHECLLKAKAMLDTLN
jgi:para-aminobenzoate synthetase component 1